MNGVLGKFDSWGGVGNLNYVSYADTEWCWSVKRQHDGKFWGIEWSTSADQELIVHRFSLRNDAKAWALAEKARASGGTWGVAPKTKAQPQNSNLAFEN